MTITLDNLAETLQQDIVRLGLAGKAWLTPYCHDMPAAMNAIDCLVHPQIGTEALGLVLCEALACGKPVIASALDGIPEAFQPAGYGQLVPPDNIEKLAAAMLHWAGQPKMTEAGRAELHRTVAEHFSMEAAVQRVLQIYNRLVPADNPSIN